MPIYGFETDDLDEATGALCVYAIWRSRDRARFKVTPSVWGQTEGFVRASAKRSHTIPDFIERLKPRLQCPTIHPSAMAVGLSGSIPLVDAGHGEFIQLGAEDEPRREFLTQVRQECDERRVCKLLYQEASWIILLVRDRLERERPIERRFETALDASYQEAMDVG